MIVDSGNSKRAYNKSWPSVRGDYMVGNPESRIAVVTLASQLQAEGAALMGPCKTENLGVEKIVANVISNSNIRFLLICGAESKGHLPGNTILALHRNGIDEQGRIIGSQGAIPFIQNLPPQAIKRFQDQIQPIDCIGIEDVIKIQQLIWKYDALSEPYREEPFELFIKRARSSEIQVKAGDLILGKGLVMDSSAWLVFEEG